MQNARFVALFAMGSVIVFLIAQRNDPVLGAGKVLVLLGFFLLSLFFIAIDAAYRFAAAIWFKFFWKSASTADLVGKLLGSSRGCLP